MSTTDERGKQPFAALKQFLYELYSKKLPRKLSIRAQHEYKVVQSIRRLRRHRSDIVVRRTDKSKVFYIGKADDLARKTEEYMLKTNAYEAITNGRCPLADSLTAVQTFLDYFVIKKALSKQLRDQLSPKLTNLELGHYHGLSKPHKVSLFHAIYNSLYSFSIGWNTLTTYYCMYACSCNIGVEIFK
jgi:hypothetical protein